MTSWTPFILASVVLLVGAGLLLDRCDSREKACVEHSYTTCTASGGNECSATARRVCVGAGSVR